MASIFGTRNVLGQSADPRTVTLEARGLVNDQLLQRLLRTLNPQVDAIARKHAERMAEYARAYAPRSSRTGSNSRNTVPMAETIKSYKRGNAQYIVTVEDLTARYVIKGTRPHIIRAGTLGARTTLKQVRNYVRQLNKVIDRESAYLQPRVTRTGRARGRLSPRESGRQAVASYMVTTLSGRVERATASAARANRAIERGGKRMLSFPWQGPKGQGWAQRINGRVTAGQFVGPLVHHPGSKGSNFLGRARARVAPGFARDLRATLEGR